MKIFRKRMVIMIASLALTKLMLGCAPYGSLLPVGGAGDPVTVDQLVEQSEQFRVFYAGYAVNNPSGILFDPVGDDRHLIPSPRWSEITGRDTAAEVVGWLRIQSGPGYFPALSRIVGPDGELYGYLFTGWHGLPTRGIEKQGLFVYDLPDPPHYYGASYERRAIGGGMD